MDSNALYYTLSTIAQTLAGALAVLVAFVLFKLSALDGAMQRAQAELHGQGYTEWPRLWDALCAGGLKGLEKELKHPVQEPRIRAAYHEGYIAWRQRPRILDVLRYALIGSVVDIGACFAALPWAPRLADSEYAAIVLFSTVILGIVCLALYVWLILMVVQRLEAPPAP